MVKRLVVEYRFSNVSNAFAQWEALFTGFGLQEVSKIMLEIASKMGKR